VRSLRAAPLPARRAGRQRQPRPLRLARRRPHPQLRRIPADARAAGPRPAGAAAARGLLPAAWALLPRSDPAGAAGRRALAGRSRPGGRQRGAVGGDRAPDRALPPRGPGACRPQRAQHPVRRQRPRLADRFRPRPHAHPGHRLARGQPAPAATFAAEAARATQRGRGREGLLAPAPRLRAVLEPGLLTMAAWSLRLHGVGNASAVALGSPMATLERDGRPWLTIDCGAEGLTAFEQHYGGHPDALFVTHVHLDHVAGFERLFVSAYFDPARRGRIRVYVPAPVVPLLHRRIGDYPNVLAEGGANFWDAFQLVPVGDAFWHEGVRLEVFPVRHHWP